MQVTRRQSVPVDHPYPLFTSGCHHGGMTSTRPAAALTDAFEQPTSRTVRPTWRRSARTSRTTSTRSTTPAPRSCPTDRFLDRELSGCASTSGCSSSPRTRACRCSSGPGSPRSSPRNLDEFFMVRVAGLKRRIVAGVAVPQRQRAAAARGARARSGPTTTDLMQRHAAVFRDKIIPALAEEDIELLRWADLDRDEQKQLQEAVQGAHLPGAHAAGGRPGAPVPLHLRAVAQPRRAGAQPEDRQGALRPGQGAADLPPVRGRRRAAVRAARGRHRRAPQAAVPGHGRGRRALASG